MIISKKDLTNLIDAARRRFVGLSLKSSKSEEKTYFTLTIVTGILSALTAIALYKSVTLLKTLIGTDKEFTIQTTLIGLVLIVTSGWLTTRKFPNSSGSGLPGVRIALAVFHGKLALKDTIAKFFTSLLSLGCGFSLGREGPTASISAGIGSFLGNFFHLSKKRVKALVAVGTAGGIAAAFNTPMAAVVFTLEEIVGDLNAKILGSIIISSVVASIVGQAFLGTEGHFTQLNYQLNDAREIILYLMVGLLAGVLGSVWVKSVTKYREKINILFHGHKLTIITFTFLIIAIIGHINIQAIGDGHSTIENALQSMILDWRVLLTLFTLKFVATTICYGSGVSGGLFMPTLLMGATLGGFTGSLFNLIIPEISPNVGAFALIGMGAYFAAVIRAPITSILIIFELTRDYNIILPLMVANIFSYFLSSKIHKGSIYENIAEQDGIHLPAKEDEEILENLAVEDAMVKNIVSLCSSDKINSIYNDLKNKSISGYPVLKESRLIGMTSFSNIASSYSAKKTLDLTVEDVCTKKIIKIYPDQSLLLALHLMDKFHISRLPVVSRLNDKNLIGIITANDVVNKFGLHINEDDQIRQ